MRRSSTFIQFLVVVGVLALATTGTAQNGPDPQLNQGPKPTVSGDSVMVATQLPVVSNAALQVLKDGGNAVDAMVTSVFVQHVQDFHQVSHFGSMSVIGYDAASDTYWSLNAVSERPRADRHDHGDVSKVAIGGVVRGLEAIAERYGSGTMEWSQYLQPAIASAEEGAIVTSFMYGINYNLMEQGDLVKNPEAREAYMANGHLVPVGERWKRPALAKHLKMVASEGADYMYTGAWAEKFVKAANAKGFAVSMQDMAEYKPHWDDPTKFTYRGLDFYGSPPPDTGGVIVGSNLKILENFDLKGMGHYSESPEALEIMIRAFGRVSDETRWVIKDPLNFKMPTDLWLSDEYGKLGATFVENTMLLDGVDLSNSETPDMTASLFPPGAGGADTADLGSNHNVIVDSHGNWVSMLHTGHGGAPGIFIDGVRATGSTARAATAGPGRRLVLPITGIIVAKDGKPWLAMGTPGSPPQPVTEVLVNIIDYGMHPKDAAAAPRFWAFRGGERGVQIESRISDAVRKGMKKSGIAITDLGAYNWHTGSMQIIWMGDDGKLHGATDPRRLGVVVGY